MNDAAAGAELERELAAIVGERRVSLSETERATYARDMWPRELLRVRAGEPPAHMPHAVVWPETAREVAAIIRLARELRMAIVPYGGGSGVCGGAVPIRGGITIDMKRMDRVLAISRDEMTVDVQAGANGERFERELQSRGYTLGHFPSSIYCSTVGGWLACRAAGQLSTKYGKIEDRVVGLTVVTGRGEIVHTDGLPRAHRGPDWTQLLVGSEGTLGIITSARLRVAAQPELVVMRGFQFDDVTAGIEAIRRVMQRGLRPAVVRLYDEVDTFINHVSVFGGHEEVGDIDHNQFAPAPESGSGALPQVPSRPGERRREGGLGSRLAAALSPSPRAIERRVRELKKSALAAALARPRLVNSVAGAVADRVARRGCRLIVGLEGSRIRTDVESRLTFAELERAGGTDLGEEPGREWLEHRYAVSYKMSKVFRDGAFVDTMEVAATWDRLLDLYHSVKQAIARHAVVMAHFSHAYPEGCSIYFTFVARADDLRADERLYDAIWRDALAACTRAGGTISHHHGVGLLKSSFMHAEHREAMTILRAVKHSLDPDNIMNPGKLGMSSRVGGTP